MSVRDAIPADPSDPVDPALDPAVDPDAVDPTDGADPSVPTDPAAPAGGEPVGEPTPELLAGKFKTQDELIKGYSNLEGAFGKFGGKTPEELTQMELDAEAFRKLQGGLPAAPDKGQPGENPSAELFKAAGVDFSDVDWDTILPDEYHSRVEDALGKVVTYMTGQIPDMIGNYLAGIEAADTEVADWESKEPLLKNETFRDMVADLTDQNVPLDQAVAQVREKWSTITKTGSAPVAPAPTRPAPRPPVAPRSGAGSQPAGDRKMGVREAFEEAEKQTGYSVAPLD